MKLNKPRLVILIVTSLVVAGCLLWEFYNSNISSLRVKQNVSTILNSQFGLELTNSWSMVNASGGSVGSLILSPRPRSEYFLQMESDFAAVDLLSEKFGKQKTIDVTFFSFEDDARIFMPHETTKDLAPWWQPETNSEPMMSMHTSFKDTVFIYGFKKRTNALLYIHVIEQR